MCFLGRAFNVSRSVVIIQFYQIFLGVTASWEKFNKRPQRMDGEEEGEEGQSSPVECGLRRWDRDFWRKTWGFLTAVLQATVKLCPVPWHGPEKSPGPALGLESRRP